MRLRPGRLVIGLLILILLAVVLAGGFTVTSIRASLPQVDGKVELPGLGAPVQVSRDAHGVPQIYANTADDLFRAQGYVQAQDRFFEMDFRRHLTSGRLSEWFGRTTLKTDMFIRTLGWRRIATEELGRLSPTTRRYLEAYADGVNAYLADHKGSALSVEYTLGLLGPDDQHVDPWRPEDSLAWLKAMAWDLRGNLDDEITRTLASVKLPTRKVDQLYPDYPYDREPTIVGSTDLPSTSTSTTRPRSGKRSPRRVTSSALRLGRDTAAVLQGVRRTLDAAPSAGSRAGIGSNSWVVSGRLTTTGKPLLANDPHLAPSIPSIWYQNGLHCRTITEACPFDVTGFSFSGLPGVVIGHNDRIAWGMTNLGADVTDLYVERLDGDTYLYNGKRVPLDTRREVFGVKGEPDVTIDVRTTRHGPLVSDVDAQMRKVAAHAPAGRTSSTGGLQTGVALRWTALDPGRTADALFELDAARDWKSFRKAAQSFEVPAQNLVYADVDGHIGYQTPGRIPIRGAGDGRWPMPGWDSAYDWKGYIPFDKLPSVEDPKQGFVVTANNAVAGKAYPYHLADVWSYGSRAGRITDLIRQGTANGRKLTPAEMARIQLDTKNPFASTLLPYLEKVPVDGFTAQGKATLRGWNGMQGLDSAGAAYFDAVWKHLLLDTFGDELPKDAQPGGGDRWFEVLRGLVKDSHDAWWDDVRTKHVRETRDDILRRAMVDARLDLTKKLNKDPSVWRWGHLHRLELTETPFGVSGIGPLESFYNRGLIEVPGGSDAVDATGWNVADTTSKGYDVTSLPSMRMVVDLSALDSSRWVDLTGTSGHPWSPQYDDQVALWATGRTTAWPFSPAAVRSTTLHTLTLNP